MTDLKAITEKPASARMRAWGLLICGFLGVGLFAFVIGPWLEERIPIYSQIVQVIEEQDIDSGAYFYSEIKGSYEGERYLLESMKLAAPDKVGFTPPFVLCIVLCILILAIGYRFLPMD